MKMEVDEVLQDPVKQSLRQFRCNVKFPRINPEIIVAGLGLLNLPLLESDVDQLAKISSLAHVDKTDPEKLCRTWHLDLSGFTLNNSNHWHEAVSELVNNWIRLELGLTKNEKIVPKLCKLLLHERGGRPFVPFNDANAPISINNTNTDNNEDKEFVLATLSILLPSFHSAGEIFVAFKVQQPAFDVVNTTNIDSSFYDLFFLESHHVIAKSVANEANLALAYNLVCSSECCEPSVTENSIVISRVKQFFESWQMGNENHEYDMLSVVFDCKYKANGISWQSWKNCDKEVALTIIAAARETEFDVFFSKFTCYERIGSYKCGLDDLDLCDGEKAYTFSEFVNTSAEEFDTMGIFNGHLGEARVLRVHTDKMSSSCKNFQLRPANMKDRCCWQVALVLWQKKNFDSIMLKEQSKLAVVSSMDWAQQLAKFHSGHPQEQCGDVFTAIISRHGVNRNNAPFNFISLDTLGQFDNSASICLIDAFKKTNNKYMFQLFVESVLVSRAGTLSVNLLKELIDCSMEFGLDLAFPILNTLIEDDTVFYTTVTLLRELCTLMTEGSTHYSAVVAWFAPKLLDQLDVPLSLVEQKMKFIPRLMGRYYKAIATATSLLCIYSSLGNNSWLLRVIQYIRQTPDRHPVSTVTMHVLHHWNSWLDAELAKNADAATAMRFVVEQNVKFIEDCIEQLKQSSQPPPEPKNWSLVVNLTCQCQDCKSIKYFMEHPKQRILNMFLGEPMSHERKCHILETCKKIPNLSVRFKSNNYITICKIQASYEMEKKSYQQSMLAVENLLALLPPEHPLLQKQKIVTCVKQQPNEKILPMIKPNHHNGKIVPKKKPKLDNY